MKVLITSQGRELTSSVDQRFGRAKWYVLYDTETEKVNAFENIQNMRAMQGAGIQAAENVARLGADCVLTGHCGPKAFRALSAADIKVFVGAGGTVAEAVESFKSGELKMADKPDVQGHWS